ncbi:MAG: UDP-2,3-diacylglucosamine diphosphatase [Bacteroidia bacterium]|nr:UDP-2,3-diacylglucosamine diphosphatase [Bacteroidia bacterium]
MKQQGLIYFLSDAHLGAPDHQSSLKREMMLVAFLDEIKDSASEIFFMGDLFDFWFEYKRVVPRGFSRILGKIAELSDRGIRLHYFTGNHDIWMFDYLTQETGIKLYRHPTAITLDDKHFFLAHGDGLDEQDHTFRLLKWIFTNKFLQWVFARLHPNFAFWIANGWSRHSRSLHGVDPFKEEKEPIVQYSRKYLEHKGYDYLVFGHRHCPVDYRLNDHTRLFILGDWLSHFSYAVFDGETLQLKHL